VIKGGLAERWSDRPVTKIHPHDIWAVVDEARRLGVPGLERRAVGRTDPLGRVMLACLSSFFGWLKKTGGRSAIHARTSTGRRRRRPATAC
jgi:hypothetical protein